MTRTRINLAGYARLHGLEAAPRAEQIQHARAAGWTVSDGDTLTRYSRADGYSRTTVSLVDGRSDRSKLGA